MNQEIYSRFDKTINHLFEVLDTVPQEQINIVPFEGSWTAGQVTDHMLKSMGNMGTVLNKDTKPADRDPIEKKQQLEDIFLNYDHKMKSPEFILPSNDPLDKAELKSKIQGIREVVLEVIRNKDLTELCMGFEFPGMGHITRQELIWFVIYHTQRHTHQLQRIQDVLGK